MESCQVLDSNSTIANSSEGATEKEKDKDIRQPTIARWLDNVALRDMQLHRRHAACVDARGDVYQWGDGFFGPMLEGSAKPIPTLKGKVRLLYLQELAVTKLGL